MENDKKNKTNSKNDNSKNLEKMMVKRSRKWKIMRVM